MLARQESILNGLVFFVDFFPQPLVDGFSKLWLRGKGNLRVETLIPSGSVPSTVLVHGHSRFSAGIRFLTFRFPFPRSHSLENPSTKGCEKKRKLEYSWGSADFLVLAAGSAYSCKNKCDIAQKSC